MYRYLPYLFTLNIFLIFMDATIGYHAAPTLARLGGDQADGEVAVRGVRTLLSGVVALYMFFNCLFYFTPRPLLLLMTGAVIVVDVVAQLLLALKIQRRNQQ